MPDDTEVGKTYFRYRDALASHFLVARLELFEVIQETPKGVWVAPQWMVGVMGHESLKKARKWVAKGGRKRFCYPTLEQAWESYCKRKHAHLERLERELTLARKRANVVANIGLSKVIGKREVKLGLHCLRDPEM